MCVCGEECRPANNNYNEFEVLDSGTNKSKTMIFFYLIIFLFFLGGGGGGIPHLFSFSSSFFPRPFVFLNNYFLLKTAKRSCW